MYGLMCIFRLHSSFGFRFIPKLYIHSKKHAINSVMMSMRQFFKFFIEFLIHSLFFHCISRYAIGIINNQVRCMSFLFSFSFLCTDIYIDIINYPLHQRRLKLSQSMTALPTRAIPRLHTLHDYMCQVSNHKMSPPYEDTVRKDISPGTEHL